QARRIVDAVRLPFVGSRTVAVVSTKGGVGKTTTALHLGHTLATVRGDRVVALDANADAGNLALRVPRETDATSLDLLHELEEIDDHRALRSFTSQAPSRLEVVAAPLDPRLTRRLGRHEYDRLLACLSQHYNLVLADCGTGILDPATRGVVQAADALVLVTDARVDGARSLAYLARWLEEHGLARLVADAVVVFNGVGQRSRVDVDALERHFAEQVRVVTEVPWDPVLARGGITTASALRPSTRNAYLRLAAAVAADLATPGRTAHAHL
ncbi:MAG: MinD/ParA family protein, partial [Actinobacteria bacterium]|nr:MinD/ParA family protein [Actinomycetota bacterium]